jgi:Ubiquitin binding region
LIIEASGGSIVTNFLRRQDQDEEDIDFDDEDDDADLT